MIGEKRDNPPLRITLGVTRFVCFVASVAAVNPASGADWISIGPGGGGWIQDVRWSSIDENTLYVAGDVSGLLQSSDGGKTFLAKNEGLSDYFVQTVEELTVDSHVRLLAGTLGGPYLRDSTDDGWRLSRDGFRGMTKYSYSSPVSVIRRDANSEGTIYAGIGVPRWQKLGQSAVMVSGDWGQTWQQRYLNRVKGNDIVTDIETGVGDRNAVLVSTSSGVFRSNNHGAEWTRSDKGIERQWVESIAVSRTNPAIVFATTLPLNRQPSRVGADQDNWSGGIFRSADGGVSWKRLATEGLGRTLGRGSSLARQTSAYKTVAVSPRNENLVFVGDDSWVTGGVYRSRDGGENWERVLSLGVVDRLKGNVDKVGWIKHWAVNVTAMDISTINPDKIVIGSSGHLIVTEDGGDTWRNAFTRISTDGGYSGNGLETLVVNDVLVAGPSAATIFACYADVGLFASSDKGESFRESTQAVLGLKSCSRVVADPIEPAKVWASIQINTGQHATAIIYSDGDSRDWQVFPISRNVVGSIVDFTAVRTKELSGLVAVGIDGSLYLSENDGRSWESFYKGRPGKLAPSQITSIAFSPHSKGKLIVGVKPTQGAARIFESSVGGVPEWRPISCSSSLGEIKRIRADTRFPNLLTVSVRSQDKTQSPNPRDGGVFIIDLDLNTCSRVISTRFANDAIIRKGPNDILAATLEHPYFDGAVGGGVVWSEKPSQALIRGSRSAPSRNITSLALSGDAKTIYAGTNGNGLLKLDSAVGDH